MNLVWWISDSVIHFIHCLLDKPLLNIKQHDRIIQKPQTKLRISAFLPKQAQPGGKDLKGSLTHHCNNVGQDIKAHKWGRDAEGTGAWTYSQASNCSFLNSAWFAFLSNHNNLVFLIFIGSIVNKYYYSIEYFLYILQTGECTVYPKRINLRLHFLLLPLV